MVGWLEVVYCGGRGKLSSAEPAVQTMVAENLHQTYMTALYHTYTTTRIDQLFNIVIGGSCGQKGMKVFLIIKERKKSCYRERCKGGCEGEMGEGIMGRKGKEKG